jgi:hypothetical protein
MGFVFVMACGGTPPVQETSPSKQETPVTATPPVASPAPPDTSQEPVAPPPAEPIPPRESTGPVPAGDATGSFAAPARADWPCAFRKRYRSDEDWTVSLRFVYGTRASCRLPISFVDEGMVGCVDRAVTPFRGAFYDLHRLAYAGNGMLTRDESNLGSITYTWEGNIPQPSDAIKTTRTPGRLETSLIGRNVVDVDEHGRPLRTWYVEKGKLDSRCEYTWNKARFEGKQCHDGDGNATWRYEAIYDCKSLPPIKPSANRNGEPGVPL